MINENNMMNMVFNFNGLVTDYGVGPDEIADNKDLKSRLENGGTTVTAEMQIKGETLTVKIKEEGEPITGLKDEMVKFYHEDLGVALMRRARTTLTYDELEGLLWRLNRVNKQREFLDDITMHIHNSISLAKAGVTFDKYGIFGIKTVLLSAAIMVARDVRSIMRLPDLYEFVKEEDWDEIKDIPEVPERMDTREQDLGDDNSTIDHYKSVLEDVEEKVRGFGQSVFYRTVSGLREMYNIG